MEVAAPAEVPAAPFALCPRFEMMAVGVTAPAAAPGDAKTGASRVDFLRLLQATGEYNLERHLDVGCSVPAPGLRRLAWSSTPKHPEPASYFNLVEELLYPAGLLAGGFDDGSVKIWNPERALGRDMNNSSVSDKPAPLLILNEDPVKAKNEEHQISTALEKMYSEMDDIHWGTDNMQKKEDDGSEEMVHSDSEWELVPNEKPVANHDGTEKMELLVETHNLLGPVLGLSFSDVYPSWMASAALGERICIHDLNHPFLVQKKKLKLPYSDSSEISTQITSLNWSKTHPCLLASASDTGVTKLWDVRAPTSIANFRSTRDDRRSSSDLEFSFNNPWHLAVSSANSGKLAAVKIWDLRYYPDPCHQYGFGASGVLSLSWNRCGHLLASHKNGNISCYDPYRKKSLEEMTIVDCDLGLTWTHSDDTVALFSSEYGVRLSQIGWMLEDGM